MPEILRATYEDNSHRHIDDHLRRVYEMYLFEQIPDRFRSLLEKLRQQQAVA